MIVARNLRWAVPNLASVVFRASRQEATVDNRRSEIRPRTGFLTDFQRLLEKNVQLVVDQMLAVDQMKD